MDIKKIIVVLIIFGLGWFGNQKYRTKTSRYSATTAVSVDSPQMEASSNDSRFKCDGRTHCSHMTSCEEATFFINNCPDTKMDGDNDGIPCEKQWCR